MPFVQATRHPTGYFVPTVEDVRAAPLDPLRVTQEQQRRLHGLVYARCGRRAGVRPRGMAHLQSGPNGAGRLGYPVLVCPERARIGGTW